MGPMIRVAEKVQEKCDKEIWPRLVANGPSWREVSPSEVETSHSHSHSGLSGYQLAAQKVIQRCNFNSVTVQQASGYKLWTSALLASFTGSLTAHLSRGSAVSKTLGTAFKNKPWM